jgi:ribose transport system permease protein
MSETTSTTPATAPDAGQESKPKRRINLGFDKFSGIYVWALLVVIFSLWIPDLFLSWDNFTTILTFQAISTIVALGLIIPVAAGAFDLTIAGTLTVSACFTAWALLNHKGVVFACGGAIIIGVIIGLANSLVVVKLKVDSFIGTLGMSSILAAVAYMISGGGQEVLPEVGYLPFLNFARATWFGVSASVYYAGILAIIIWWILEYTPGGRYLYAVGGNPVAARLAGVKVGRVVMMSFIASAVVSSFAGIVYLAQNANAAPDSGTNYLLPAFSAVFLGATQIRPGRVNVLGTLVAILLLATGVTGLQLGGAPTYVTQLFNGAALIIAMALAARTARRRG